MRRRTLYPLVVGGTHGARFRWAIPLMSLRHVGAMCLALCLIPTSGFGQDYGPPFDMSNVDRLCANHNSSTIRSCEASADAATGAASIDLDFVTPDEGLSAGYGGATATTHVGTSHTTVSATRSVTVDVTFHVLDASASHSGLLTNSVGRMHSGFTGLASVYLEAIATSDCGVRPNYCFGRAVDRIVSSRDLVQRSIQDETFTLRLQASAANGTEIRAGTDFTLLAGGYAEMRVDTASGPDNGEVTVKLALVVEAISAQETG